MEQPRLDVADRGGRIGRAVVAGRDHVLTVTIPDVSHQDVVDRLAGGIERLRVHVHAAATVGDAMTGIEYLRRRIQPLIEAAEVALLDLAMEDGAGWGVLGQAYEPALSQPVLAARYRRLGGRRSYEEGLAAGGLTEVSEMSPQPASSSA